MQLNDIDTPALLVDLEAMERNIARLAEFFSIRPARIRPHAKTHKCPPVAWAQVRAGAIGVTCAKLGEAEVMAQAGLPGILIANEVTGHLKLPRLIGLARQADLTVAIDDVGNARAIDALAADAGVTVNVLLEVDVGRHRAGVQPGAPALDLARELRELRHVRLRGLLGYEGHAVLIPDRDRRLEAGTAAMKLLVDTANLMRSEGLPCGIVSAGGTGTYDVAGSYPGVTEVEAGSYVFMDRRYLGLSLPFEPALHVLTTITSRPAADRIVTDAGLKAVTPEFGFPLVADIEACEYTSLSEEHGIARLGHESAGLRPGDRLRLIPGHCCTTVNLYDRLHALRGERVEAIWPVAARGRSD